LPKYQKRNFQSQKENSPPKKILPVISKRGGFVERKVKLEYFFSSYKLKERELF